MAKPKKIRKKPDPNGWLTTYGDMITLVLCFFVLLMGEPAQDPARLQLVATSFGGLGPLAGGLTLDESPLALMGANIQELPASRQSTALGKARAQAEALMQSPDEQVIQNVVMDPERGLVITLAGEVLFGPNSAQVEIESVRRTLQQLALLLNSPELRGSTFRVEGHADGTAASTANYPTDWELSAARAINVLHYLVDYGVSDRRFQVMGLADTRPVRFGNTPEDAAHNRRVELVILTTGHI